MTTKPEDLHSIKANRGNRGHGTRKSNQTSANLKYHKHDVFLLQD